MEKRGGALIDIDRDALEQRMRMYYDKDVTWNELDALETGLTRDAAEFAATDVRSRVLDRESFDSARLRSYAVRPFDERFCYYSAVQPLWNRPRPRLWQQIWEGNAFLLSRMKAASDDEGVPFYFVRGLSDDHLLAPDAVCFPLRLRQGSGGSVPQTADQTSLFDPDSPDSVNITANVSSAARTYLQSLGITRPDADAETASLPWMHALAIGYSPAYLAENKDGIAQDWPRIPLPASRDALLASAALGREVAALLDPETPMSGVTTGTIRPELRAIGSIRKTDGSQVNSGAGDLALTAAWGRGGHGRPVMPGRGKSVARDFTAEEAAALATWRNPLGIETDGITTPLGDGTLDIFLNDRVYWSNIPTAVWTYTIGGYQVIKKWLSYRELTVLDRPLTIDEVREVQSIARRIAALLLLQPRLDADYRAVTAETYAWPTRPAETNQVTLAWDS